VLILTDFCCEFSTVYQTSGSIMLISKSYIAVGGDLKEDLARTAGGKSNHPKDNTWHDAISDRVL
jgi:hypothetical protein